MILSAGQLGDLSAAELASWLFGAFIATWLRRRVGRSERTGGKGLQAVDASGAQPLWGTVAG